jgi:hypothetical protein
VPDPEQLFRAEALQHLRQGEGPGRALDLGDRWIHRGYWLLVISLLIGILIFLFVPFGGSTVLHQLYPSVF